MDSLDKIKENVKNILTELPEEVKLVAAAKTRNAEEINAAISAGVYIIGENYIQEADRVKSSISGNVKWHFIGHLQKNKVKKAVEIFDLLETVDSVNLAGEIDKRCKFAGKVMPVFIEINSGREVQKSGVYPENAIQIIRDMADFQNIKVTGIMTMGPFTGDPEDARPYFKETKAVFDKLKALKIANTDIQYLSMGMTNSYLVAIEEGANIVRIGTKVFGDR